MTRFEEPQKLVSYPGLNPSVRQSGQELAYRGRIAFAGARAEAAIRARGGTPRVVQVGTWGRPDALARLEAHNAEVRRVRARIEKVFGTCKRCYGLRRMRWLGLAKAGLQVRLAAALGTFAAA